MKAIFLTTVGGTTYSVLSNLVSPAKPQDETLDELITLLKNHYEPRKIVIAERFKCYKRRQKEGESIANYVAELRRLAKDCEFADSPNTALRDRSVCGLRHESLQQKVLAERDLTLEKAPSLTRVYYWVLSERHRVAFYPCTRLFISQGPQAKPYILLTIYAVMVPPIGVADTI